MAFRLVTTCHAEGWQTYGRQMAVSFAAHWPAEVTLEIYSEGFTVDVQAPNVIERELPGWHVDWKARHATNDDAHGRDARRFGRIDQRKGKKQSYRRDCVRFSHKVAALTDAALNPVIVNRAGPPGWLVMIDADTLTHAPVTIEWLRSLVPVPGHYMAWLDRRAWYPECGFVMFDERHPAHAEFMARLCAIYSSDAVFTLPETHDSYVLQHMVGLAVAAGTFSQPFGLSGREGRQSSHPFVHSRLAERLDHAKGKFKFAGRTPRGFVKRGEGHWQ
jgi:hypothetical protein